MASAKRAPGVVGVSCGCVGGNSEELDVTLKAKSRASVSALCAVGGLREQPELDKTKAPASPKEPRSARRFESRIASSLPNFRLERSILEMVGAFRGGIDVWARLLCRVLVLVAFAALGCRRASVDGKKGPAAVVEFSATAGVANAPAPSAPVDAKDPEPIVEALQPILDDPIPTDACNSAGFCWSRPLPLNVDLNAVWAWSKSDVWVFGDAGLALHFDGKRFRQVETATSDDLVAVWGTKATEFFVLGRVGTLLRFDGKRFEGIWRSEQLENDARSGASERPEAIELADRPSLAKHPAVQTKFADELANEEHGPVRFRDLWGTAEGKLWVVGEIEITPET